VAEHVELAYATTGMGAQGRTVDVGILFLDSPTDVRNIYVPLSRGRESNMAFVATTGEVTAVDVLTRCLTTDWIDQPAHTRRAELTGATIRQPSELSGEQLRKLFADQYDLGGLVRDGGATAADRARLEGIDESIWSDVHVRAHRLRLEEPDWAIEALGRIPEAGAPRRVWGVFAGRLIQHHVVYNEIIDHQAAYEFHREIVDDILDQMRIVRSLEIASSIDLFVTPSCALRR
jgi:hypothetical protein